MLSPSEVKIMMKYMIRIKVHNYFFIAQILKVLRAFPINAKKKLILERKHSSRLRKVTTKKDDKSGVSLRTLFFHFVTFAN